MLPVIDVKRAVVLLSGGLDSCVVAAHAKAEGKEVTGLYISYGSKHEHAEHVAAEKVARALGIQRVLHHIPPIFGPSALTDGGSESNVVPARNTVLIAHGIALCAKLGGGVVLLGSNADDHKDFPDCRPPFFTWAARMAEMGTANTVTVRAPVCTMPKSEVIRMGIELRAPLELTHSCYKGERPPCGECQACQVRARAFEAIGEVDPIAVPA